CQRRFSAGVGFARFSLASGLRSCHHSGDACQGTFLSIVLAPKIYPPLAPTVNGGRTGTYGNAIGSYPPTCTGEGWEGVKIVANYKHSLKDISLQKVSSQIIFVG